jgi:hypothetical protein
MLSVVSFARKLQQLEKSFPVEKRTVITVVTQVFEARY